MLRIALALLVVLQPMLLTHCAAFAAERSPCMPHCGTPAHDQHSPTPAPCCKVVPAKTDPQAVKTATVPHRADDSQPVMLVAREAAVVPEVRPVHRAQASPTDVLHKRPLSELLCVLLV